MLKINNFGENLMTVSVLLEGTLKEGLANQFEEICTDAFKVTRAFDGCQNINLTFNVENKQNYVLTEVWDSKEHYEKYNHLHVALFQAATLHYSAHSSETSQIRSMKKLAPIRLAKDDQIL